MDPTIEVKKTTAMMEDLVIEDVAPARHGALSALEQLHSDMRQVGVTFERLNEIVSALNGRYAQSASAGVSLASLNDHVAIASFPFQFRSVKVAEHMLVIKDTFEDAQGKAERYFIKGYAGRLVSPEDLLGFAARHDEFAAAEQRKNQAKKNPGKDKGKGKQAATPDFTEMETYFRSYLLERSRKSMLFARRSVDESTTVVMPIPPNAPPFPRRSAWSNAENYMAKGFGARPEVTERADRKTHSDFVLGYSDINGPENRNIIFITDQRQHEDPRPLQQRAYGEYPASLNVGGGMLAEIDGFDAQGVEVMGVAGKDPGVKMATLRHAVNELFKRDPGNLKLIVRTEDNYRHLFEYTPSGLKMTLLDQHGDPATALSPLPGADVSVYGWNGVNTGPYGSPDGYANPMIIVSTGDSIPAGPFLKDRHSIKGIITAASHAAVDVLLNDMNVGVKGTTVNSALRTTMRAIVTTSTVLAMNAFIKHFRDPHTQTLFEGAQPFTGSGSGTVDTKTLAGAIALTVLAQDVISTAYRFGYNNFVKDTHKSRERLTGQIFNEALLPFLGELGRLTANYGIQKAVGLPRGNEKDVYSLFGVAIALTAIDFLRGRAGDPANHLFQSATFKAMDFFAADLIFRTLGAVYGTTPPSLDAGQGEHVHTDQAKNLLEAFVTRLAVRGVDKFLLPELALLSNALRFSGDHARAGEVQLARENAGNHLLAKTNFVLDLFSVETERMLETGREKLDDVEALRGASVWLSNVVETVRLELNHINLETSKTVESELAQVREAARFHEMSEAEQIAHLQNVEKRFNDMIASSKAFQQGSLHPVLDEASETGETRPSAPVDLSMAVSNSSANLPGRIREKIEKMMREFPAAYAADDELRYINEPSHNPRSAPVPYNATPANNFGKTARVLREHSTFTDAQVSHVKQIHKALEAAPGTPRKPQDSNPLYKRLDARMIDEGNRWIHAYSLESQLFHYLLRWPQTGQPRYLRLAPGAWFKTAVMNHPGNQTGDRDKFITPMSVGIVNLMTLHAEPLRDTVHRGVVTDAFYVDRERQDQARDRYGADAVLIDRNALVAMTEFMSVTSSTQMTATFLQGLGHGASPPERTQHMVIRQETAIPIPRYTEHLQVESILMPGTVGLVSHIDHDPPPLEGRDIKQKGPAAPVTAAADAAANKEFNLGQVVYLDIVDTFQAEVHYRRYLEARQQAEQSGEDAVIPIPDGAICCHPDTGQLYKYDAATRSMHFTDGTLNYFHGAKLEATEDKPARWRHPFTSALSPSQIRIGILGAILTDHPAVPYLNDMVRNVSHEAYRRKGGYYDPTHENHRYKIADDAHRAAYKNGAQRAIKAISGLTATTPFELPEAGKVFVEGKPFPGELLARVMSSALHRPVMIMEVDGRGKPIMERTQVTDHNDRERTRELPAVRHHFIKTHDLFDLTYDTQRAPMIGVGPKGYYVVVHHEGAFHAVPVNIAGPGLLAGNLMHAFLALAYPNPNRNRYNVKGNEIVSATAGNSNWRKLMRLPSDPVAGAANDMLKRFRSFAQADYDPIDQWLDQTYTDLYGPAPAGGHDDKAAGGAKA
ncbi:MAG: hypothetical protein GAK35_02826 [Herbaspirillum frisingense]|uniref:Uncharacterized protein n=1 Tax=Herbaspirillum frisingense TaxID=92645 RepID=A0A7V8FVD9_9BURK|nr:MAG: hypothetical protein GAK35_02826 [Herbaspirillum frisingense]